MPSSNLSPANAAFADDKAQVSGMFGSIAGVYDFLNHALSLGIDFYWRRALIAAARPALRYVRAGDAPPCILDLAAGTFDVSVALAAAYPEFGILGLDLCLPMLRKGLPKLRAKGLQGRVLPVGADAFALPLRPASVDCITIAFGLRNMRPRELVFAELLRVLRPGGKLCVLEFGSAKRLVWGGLYNFYLSRVLPAIGGLVSRDRAAYEYLAQSVREFPLAHELAAEMQESGFKSVEYRSFTSGIVYLHCGYK